MLSRLFGRATAADLDRTPPRAAGLALEPLEARDNPVAFYVVPGAAGTTTALDFSWLDKDAAFSNEIGVYRVNDATGAIGNLAVGDAGYAQAALAAATPVFARGQTTGARNVQTFAAGTVLGFYLAQNTTAAAVRAANPTNAPVAGATVFFSFAGANSDGAEHARGALAGTAETVRFEDGLRGGDGDFDDAVIRVRTINPNLAAGTTGQTVPTAFRLNRRDAALHSEIGVYAFDDSSGAVSGVRPTDPGYAAAVLRSPGRAVLFSPASAVGAVAGAALPGGGNFGFYLIAGGTAGELQTFNPTNAAGGMPVMYFSQAGANPDSFLHVRQRDNTLYFEDGRNGGDQDFNDAVVSFAFGSPVGTATGAAVSPPTITDVPDRTINRNTATGALPFTVGSSLTAAANLTVTATSSDQALVPNANIVLGGSGASRTVTVTPAAGQSGAAVITLTVSDGTRTATDTFTLTVSPIDGPTFAASDPPTAAFNAGAQTVSGFATFTPSPGGGTTPTYTVSGVSNPGLFAVAPAVSADGTLTYTAKTGGFGSSTFTVQVGDGAGNSSTPKTFTVRVDPVQGVSPTTIPGTAISLSDPNWVAIPTVVPAGNSAGIPAGTVADGTRILDVAVGGGAAVARGDQVTVNYRGYLLDGTVFDQNTAQFTANETSLIPGFAAGLIGMRVGGTRRIDISSYLAYGAGTQVGPPNSRLVFDVTVNSIP